MRLSQPFNRIVVKTAAAATAIFVALSTGAHALETGLDASGNAAGFTTGEVDLAASVGQIIFYILGFVGIIFLLLTVYGGFLYMTAQGNTEQLKKARGVIINAAIGLVIVFAAYAITYFVVETATTVTTATSST